MASQKKNKKLTTDAAGQGSRRNGKNARDGGNGSVSSGGGMPQPQPNGSAPGSGVNTPGAGPGGGQPGGVLAAMTKHANGKFTMLPDVGNNTIASPRRPLSPSAASSPTYQSPLLKPESPPPAINIPAADPELDIASPTSYPPSTVPSTAEWAKNVSGFAGSPGNLISIMGDSPPTQPSSYEDPRHISNWTPPQQRTYMNSPPVNQAPLPASPPTTQAIRRPLSFQLDGQQYPTAPDNRAERRSSMYSQYSTHPRAVSNPPLPHQPQAHFYGAPDIDLDLGATEGMKAGDRGYYFGFDTLSSAGDSNPGSHNVVLAGFEGGLDIFPVSKRSLDPQLASLRGLRGGVVSAKILPWSIPGSNNDAYVAVVIHGPYLPHQPSGADGAFSPPDRASTPAGSVRDGGGRQGNAIEYYQTTVEVYSLQTGRQVEVLLELPRVRLVNPMTSPIFKVPPPTGAFQIHADGGTVVVASGQTGECWVYRHLVVGQETLPRFFGAAKLWTCLQQSPKADSSQEIEPSPYTPARRPSPQPPIVTISGRWIAYCPASPSSQIALKASVPVKWYGKAPGITSMTPPQLPLVNSDLDLPDGGSVMNRLLRETTQELIVGAKWVGQHGKRMWNDYWYKNPQQARSPPSSSQSGWQRQDGPQFPPTHGAPAPAPVVNKDPGIVSIVDAYALGSTTTIHPIVTFSPQVGCSFLSFTPSGLSLFTASSKGDVQTIWDLMRIQYTKSSPLQASLSTDLSGPRVRQIAQFSRMTVARIVDVAWTKPGGERFAVVTERGTVHLHDMPPNAFSWPPPRRHIPVPDSSRNSMSEGSNPATSAAVSIASTAFSTAASVARPLITRPRRSSLQTGGTPGGASIADHASHGGRVIAASISSSLGKTGNAINQLRHTGENRVSLPSALNTPMAACITWIASRKYHTLFVLGDGIVRQFPGKSRRPSVPSNKRRAARSGSFRDFSVPPLPGDELAPAVKRYMDPDEYLELADKEDGCNTMVLEARPRTTQRNRMRVESSIPQAEIESSAPYQPFHTDRRVAISTYNPEPDVITADVSDWAFGDPIETTMISLGPAHLADEEDDLGDDAVDDPRALPQSAMERILEMGENQEQIVVTTRRRRGAARSAANASFQEDNSLFEDDCVVLDFADQRV
ncbi:hypothetical protein MKZ38_003532 [Zalerion maritima]|uniref:Uncharacterized protein n=1 Tax=Zalerion maritima TaxID=339359 RepID=A0AAD5RP49_9PEZI|nr:hypothetical protein MKZ38_003532 [Zalerion maritima]